MKQGTEYTEIHPLYLRVSQGSVFGPILYLLYTADLPTTGNTTIAIYAILASYTDPISASRNKPKHDLALFKNESPCMHHLHVEKHFLL